MHLSACEKTCSQGSGYKADKTLWGKRCATCNHGLLEELHLLHCVRAHIRKKLHGLIEPTAFRFIGGSLCFGKTINEELIEQQQNKYQDNSTTYFLIIVSSLKRTLPLSQMVRVMHLGKSAKLGFFPGRSA